MAALAVTAPLLVCATLLWLVMRSRNASDA
jgi:hypothetical protein